MKQTTSPPRHNAEIENAIIGALLIDANAPFVVLPIIRTPGVFYVPANAVIFETVQNMVGKNLKVDLLTVSAQLRKDGNIDAVGGDYYLATLAAGVASSAHIEQHCLLLLEFWIARELQKEGANLAVNAAIDTNDPLQLLDATRATFDAIGDQLTQDVARDWQSILQDVTLDVERLADAPAGITGVPTGFAVLDSYTGGWQPGQLIIMAARPGMGKTAMAVKHVNVAAQNGFGVAVFELEMRDTDFAKRIIANISNLHANQLFVHGLNNANHDYWPGYWAAITKVEKWNLHIKTRPGLSVYDLQIEARKLVNRHGVKLIIVDYLQLMRVGRDSRTINNREQEISTISRMLKQTALELGVPIIALSQLTREVDKRADKRPRLMDLRESGSLEQDADIVLFIHRPDYYFEGTNEQPEYILEKHRNGQTGTFAINYDGNRMRFACPETETQQQNAF